MRSRTAAALAAGLVLAMTACASPSAETVASGSPSASVEPATAAPTAAASPSATPSVPADPHAGWQRVATPNGTATFAIPPGWSAEFHGEEVEYDGELHWHNVIAVLDESGTEQLRYGDGPFVDVGVAARFGVVAGERVATLDEEERAAVDLDGSDPSYLDHAALAWWTGGVPPEISAIVSLALAATLNGDQPPGLMASDGQRAITFSARREMSSVAEAEAWLAGEEAARLLEIIGTLDLTAVPASAMP